MRISQKISKLRGSTVRIRYKPVLKPAHTDQGQRNQLHGCCLEFVPLQRGTHVVGKVFAGSDFFEANGSVVFSQPNMGTEPRVS